MTIYVSSGVYEYNFTVNLNKSVSGDLIAYTSDSGELARKYVEGNKCTFKFTSPKSSLKLDFRMSDGTKLSTSSISVTPSTNSVPVG